MSINKIKVTKNDTKFDVISNPSTQWIWNEILQNRWEEETFKIFDRFLKPEKSYFDIGAWIGPTVLYGANRAKRVYGVEPDPIAYHELLTNVIMNPEIASKVICINAAVADKTEDKKLYMRHHFGDSTSSMIPTISSENYCKIRAVTINDLIKQHNIEDINFIKMDIEGGEYSLIPFIQSYLEENHPTLYLSIHPGFLSQHYSLTLTENEVAEKLKNQTENMLNHLSFYKNIYDIHGNQVKKEDVFQINNTGEFVFTNETW